MFPVSRTLDRKVRAAIAGIPESAWVDIDYTISGDAQVAETSYVGGGRRKRDRRIVRLVVRRTRLAARNATNARRWFRDVVERLCSVRLG